MHHLRFRIVRRFDAAKLPNMREPDGEHHTDMRRRHCGQTRNLAGCARPHLGDQDLGVGLDPKHSERPTNLVVERLFACDRRTTVRRHRRNKILRRGLSV